MEKRDMVDLIDAARGLIILDKAIIALTGTYLEGEESSKIDLVWDVIHRNSNPKFFSDDLKDADAAFADFMDIMQKTDITPEEQYELLMAD